MVGDEDADATVAEEAEEPVHEEGVAGEAWAQEEEDPDA